VDEERARAEARTDLLTSETLAISAKHQVTKRAEILLAFKALTLADVLEVLRISRATWYRRLEALNEWEAESQTSSGGETIP
jgi:hypothetical protein